MGDGTVEHIVRLCHPILFMLKTFTIDICYFTLFKHLSAEGFLITK